MCSPNKFVFCNIFCRSDFDHRKLLIAVLYCLKQRRWRGDDLFLNSSFLQSNVYLVLSFQVSSSKVVIDDIP